MEQQFFSSQEMENMFRRVLETQLNQLGFEWVGKARWVRDTQIGLKHVFFLYPTRPGADYRPLGGLSLDFVPRIEAGRARIRTQARFVRIHIPSGDDKSLNELAWEQKISRQRNLSETQCREVASKAVGVINQWLSSFTSIATVVDTLETLKDKHGKTGFYCYPEMALAYAFSLAKVGRPTDAGAELSEVLRSTYFPEETHDQIRQLLARIDEL